LPAVVTQASAVWRFVRKDGTREEVKPNGRFSVNDPRVAVEGAASGLGITCAPAEMLDGRGEKIARLTVKGRSPAPRDVFVVYPSRRLIPSRVRALLDWIFKVGK
jgi:DNA-binding transcriptional LysR family regulator